MRISFSFRRGLRAWLLLCAMLAAGLQGAAAQAVVEWVAPPVWMQTPEAIVAVQPGMRVAPQSWLVTGRGGEVGVGIGQELVILGPDGVWQAPVGEGSGNAIQGEVRMRTFNPRIVQIEERRLLASSPLALLRQGADWQLFLRTGSDAQTAQALHGFLNGNGYPVRLAAPRGGADAPGGWLLLEGFRSEEAARAAGEHLATNIPWIASYLARAK